MAVNGASIPVTERFGYVKVVGFKYTWTINSFDYYNATPLGEAVLSPIFWPATNEKLKFSMELYPTGADTSHRGYVSLYLCSRSSANSVVRAKFKFSILGARGIEENTRETTRTHKFIAETKDAVFGFSDFITFLDATDARKGLLVNYNLTIVCHVKAVLNISDEPKNNIVIPFTVPKCPLLDNLGNLFETKQFSDVVLVVSGEEIKAHKAIMAMNSVVFTAMFEHKMVEHIHNRVDITDIKPAVFNEILRFMYTGNVMGIEKMAADLLAAADKYALERLKVMCEESLRASLKIENVADTLVIAHRHVADRLKPQAMKFIASHTLDVMATAGFQSMAKAHPHLVTEILHALAVRRNDEPHELMIFGIEEGTFNFHSSKRG